MRPEDDLGVQLLLLGPGGVEELAEGGEVPQQQRGLHLLGQGLHPVQGLHHRGLPLPVGPGLAGHDVGREPGLPGVAEEQVVLQLAPGLGPDAQRVHHRGVGQELDEVEAAEGGRVLVLATAGDGQLLALDAVGDLGDLVAGQRLVQPLHEHPDQGHAHGGRGPQPAPGRGVGVDEEVGPGGHPEVTGHRLDQVQLPVVLQLGAVVVGHDVVVQGLDAEAVVLAGAEGGVGVLVHGAGEHHAPPFLGVGGDVGPPAAEGDAERGLGPVDLHARPPGRGSRSRTLR